MVTREQPGKVRRKWALIVVVWLVAVIPLHGQQAPALAEGTRALLRTDYRKAASLAEGYLKAHPESAKARILLARAEMAQGEYDSAYRNLRKVLGANPQNVDALYYLGWVCFALSQTEHQKLYALAPDSARVHQLLAESYRAQQNNSKAEEEYRKALAANPNSVEILNELGDLKRSQFKFDEAITYYSRALEISPRDYTSAYGLGASYLYKQEAARAVEYFRRAVAADPNSPAARLALGDALWRVGEAAEAIEELKAATSLEPDMRQAYTLLARAYNKLGQSRAAEAARKKAEELTQKEKEEREALLSSDDLAPAGSTSGSGGNREAGPKQ